MSAVSDQEASEYLAVADKFKLGMLPTEQQHKLTINMADQSRNDLPAILNILKDIDLGVIGVAVEKTGEREQLGRAIRDTFDDGNDVYANGCGATGRLSLSLERIWRSVHAGNPALVNRVHAFMSGGDLAHVHSIESFEDHPEWGAQQTRENGFGPNDLMLGITEGGETPSVIGATEEAARLSARKAFFVYCNPTDILRDRIERSRDIIDNPRIEAQELFVGNMALSGSTRLQATTIQQLMAGAALMDISTDDIRRFQEFVDNTDYGFLATFIEKEAEIYQRGGFVNYETNHYGITVMTDSTERAPTFSLKGIENQGNPERTPALSYPIMPNTNTPLEAWHELLGRYPVAIEWPVLNNVAGRERLLNFDFSRAARDQREALIGHKPDTFAINREQDRIVFSLGELRHDIPMPEMPLLMEHLLLKSMMNIHSTLVMGRIGRFESNVMIWVKPSNYKLIDRSIRYVQYLQNQQGVTLTPYDDLCRRLFAVRETLPVDQSIVLNTLKSLAQSPPVAKPS